VELEKELSRSSTGCMEKKNFGQCKKFFLNMPLDCTKLSKTNAKTNDRFQANAHGRDSTQHWIRT